MMELDLDQILLEIKYYDAILGYHEELLWPRRYRMPKLYLRDAANPFLDRNFKIKYRFCQDSVFYIVSLLRNKLQKTDKRGLPVAPEIAVLLTLRFYATASFQLVCSELISLSQPTASNVITKVSELLARLVHQFIKFPEGDGAVTNRELFKELGRHEQWPGLPNIDGAIDCTHVKIVNTPGSRHHEVYRHRKSEFSIKIQVIVGPRKEILDIVARWPGSMPNSRIFQMSAVYLKYTQGILKGRLVGDSGYPALPFVLTPIRPDPEDLPSRRYNTAQITTRNVVQHTFGIWKRRFPCLQRGLGNKLLTVCNIIVASAVLWNLALNLNDHMTFENEEEENEEDIEADETLPNTNSGFVLRNSIIEKDFT